MNATRFDALLRALTAALSRRKLARIVAGLANWHPRRLRRLNAPLCSGLMR